MHGNLRRNKAHLSHFAHHRTVENARPVAFLKTARDTFVCEAPDVLPKHDQVFR
jgi:hypothetical protein